MYTYKKLLNNSVLFAISDFATKFVQFALLPLFTVVLSTAEFGEVELIVNVVELLIPILSLGLVESAFRFAIDEKYNKKAITANAFIVSIIGLLLLSAIYMVFSSQISIEYYFYISSLYLIKIISLIIGQFSRGAGYLKAFVISSIIRAGALSITAFLSLFLFKLGIFGYILSIFVSELLYIVTLLFFRKIRHDLSIRKYDGSLLKLMLIFSLPTIPNVTFLWINQLAGRYIVASFLGLELAGIYVAASKIPAIVNILSSIFLQTWTIAAAKNINSESKSEFNTNVYHNYSSLVEIAVSGLLLFLPIISLLLLQGDFFKASQYSGLLIFAAMFNCYSSYHSAFFGAAMKNKMLMISSMIGGIINIFLSLLLINQMGILSVISAMIISNIIIVIIRYFSTKSMSSVSINWGKEILSWLLLFVQAFLIFIFGFSLFWVQILLFISVIILNAPLFLNIYNLLKKKPRTSDEH